jgi:voltage-gated potassium channel
MTALAGGVAFASVENTSVGNGIYWAITTMTTVGYGDITPKTPEGKVITITVMLVGIGFATLVIGAIAERFTNRPVHEFELTDEDLVEQVQDISARLQRLERALLQRQSGSS